MTPIKILHNGIKLSRFTEASSEIFYNKFQIDKKRPIISWVGRVESGKNADLAVLAFKEVIKKIPDAILVIAGGGNLLEKTKELSRDFSDSVIFTGMQDQGMVASLNKAATLFLFTSDTDNLPTVVIEAMACGVPIIALKDKAVFDLVDDGENGFFTRKDAKDIAEKIERVFLDTKLLAVMGKRSFEKAKGFSVDEYARRLEEIYENLISERKKEA